MPDAASAAGRGGVLLVALRTRPTAYFAQDQLIIDVSANSVTAATTPSDHAVDNRAKQQTFNVHAILHNSTQEDVYSRLCTGIVAGVCDGRSGSVLAYGQTGSGKSCTMLGDPQSFLGRGVIPRALAQIFSYVGSRPESDFSVSVSYLELYGEKLRDLLVEGGALGGGGAPGSGAASLLGAHSAVASSAQSASLLSSPSPLPAGQFEILEDAVLGTHVRGLTLLQVGSEEEALRALYSAEASRTTAEHALNARSNRAHCIFTVHLQRRNRLGAGREKLVYSKLHCVDLAGSERIKKTLGISPLADSPHANLQRESLSINKSLACLESCVNALTAKAIAGGESYHVPYRSSKLTHLLKDALGGGGHPCSSVIITCVWGEARHMEETLTTLRLAHRWAGLGTRLERKALGWRETDGSEAIILDSEELIQRLAQENTQLRQELSLQSESALILPNGSARRAHHPHPPILIRRALGQEGSPSI
jgi:kinesin family member 6/9